MGAFPDTKAAVKIIRSWICAEYSEFHPYFRGKPARRARARYVLPEAGAIYVMDRGYVDFARLYRLHQAGAFFVTRAKSNLNAHRVYSSATDRTTGVIADQRIVLDGHYTRQDYPVHIRRVRFRDPETEKPLVFLTNQTTLPALTICDLFRAAGRWSFSSSGSSSTSGSRLLRQFGECREDADLDRRVGLRAGRHHPEAAEAGGVALHIDAGDFGDSIRKSLERIMILQTTDSSGLPIDRNQMNLFSY